MFKNTTTGYLSILVRFGVLTVMLFSLTACGFHLRGNIPLSDNVKNMYVIAPSGTFKDQLEQVLTRAGADLKDSEAAADVVLFVKGAKLKRHVGTLDARGKANSYRLVFKVRYALRDLEGKNIRDLKRVQETRQYTFNPEAVVEAESEEAELLESMERDVALQIVRQLATVTDYQP